MARVLAPGGLFGFTVETHDGEGAIVGPKMRYAHSADFVRGAIAEAGLTLVELTQRLLAHGKPRAGSGAAGAGVPMTRHAARLTSVACSTDPPNCRKSSRAGSPRAAGRRARISSNCCALARAGRSALLIAPTGAGKTLAGFLPTLVESELSASRTASNAHDELGKKLISTGRGIRRAGGLHTLYISPLKALAVDIARNLERPVAEMGLPIRLETRTGDTPVSKRQRQRRDPPDILLTTPEQLALLLASDDAPFLFGSLKRVILDELHSLVMSKRGDLLSLGLARLFTIAPQLATVGLSATVAEPDDLRRYLVPQQRRRRRSPISCSPSPAPRPTSPCSTPRRSFPGPATRRAMRSAKSTA